MIRWLTPLLLLGCQRGGDVLELSTAPPSKLDGHWAVSWQIGQRQTDEPVACRAVNAESVRFQVRSAAAAGPTFRYRAGCERPGGKAWIPVSVGQWRVSAELDDAAEHAVSTIPEYTLDVTTANARPETRLLFRVNGR